MARVASQDALRPGTVLSGKIRIERIVGQGSMGIVFEATDLPLQRRVAVKIMAPERANNEESRKRFLREARAAVRLSSEHVTRLIDVGELDDGTPYLVMEYLVGDTLEVVLVRDGPPPVDVAVDWIIQALDGVAEAHRAGLVHRDLKPENLFLCERADRPPIVKVLDFGTVKDLVTKGTKLTRTGSTMGSPAYMPPEQVRAEEIDQRADVWSMGVTLYELMTGKLPFGGQSVPQTLAAILRDPTPRLRAERPDAPVELESLINCALTKDRNGRYASANELLAALSAVRARMPNTTHVTKTVRIGQNFRQAGQGGPQSHPQSQPHLPSSGRLGSSPSEPRHEAFADTLMEGSDASRVRPRLLVNELPPVPPSSSSGFGALSPSAAHFPDPHAKTNERPPKTKRKKPSSPYPIIILAGIFAIALGGVVGAIFSRRHASQIATPQPAVPTLSVTAVAATPTTPTTTSSQPTPSAVPSTEAPPPAATGKAMTPSNSKLRTKPPP